MKGIRVLYVAHTTSEGGSSTALINILKGIRMKDIECAVVVPSPTGYLVEQIKLLGVKLFVSKHLYEGYHIYPRVKSIIKWLHFYISDTIREYLGERYLREVIDAFNPDIVHSNSTACVVGYNVCKKRRIKHVWHIREYMDIGFGWTPKPSPKYHRRRLLNSFNYNIAITKAVYNYFNLRTQDTYIYDGVLDTNHSYQPQAEFKLPYFLFVGALMKSKGVGVAVQQFLKFHKTNSTHHLIIIGPSKDKKFEEYLREEINRQNATDYVHWLGFRKDVYNWMLSASALLVPSFNEGFGFICVEGMFCRTIVIGRDCAGLKEQFDNGLEETSAEIGLRFSDDDEIPSLMHRVISEDFTEMKERAYQVVTNNYTIKANTDKIYEYYCRILK